VRDTRASDLESKVLGNAGQLPICCWWDVGAQPNIFLRLGRHKGKFIARAWGPVFRSVIFCASLIHGRHSRPSCPRAITGHSKVRDSYLDPYSRAAPDCRLRRTCSVTPKAYPDLRGKLTAHPSLCFLRAPRRRKPKRQAGCESRPASAAQVPPT